jgi:NAD(P)-dependent dehydrogenase (short-subunit alcohol dehydrogenase family)
VALITGGDSGIGRAVAVLFAREGADVAVAYLDEHEDAKETKRAVEKERRRCILLSGDVADSEFCRDAVEKTVGEFGKLDILVNNAGVSGGIAPDTLDVAGWDTLMNVNAKGVFLGMKYAHAAMAKSGGGSIVNISSISGFVGQDRIHMGYNASKGAVRIMTKSAAVQFARDGIRVNSVHPGILPPMRTSVASADPVWREKTLRAVPMKREGRVEEVAHAVLFLASDDASYITGIEVPVDGGFLAV